MSIKLYPWQDALEKALLDLRDRLPNGLLVYGPRGAGIFDLVQAFAKSLLCTQPAADGTPCGRCHGCHLVRAGTHPDIRYVVSEAESLPREIPFVPPDTAASDRKTVYREILIHQTRALTDFLNLKSHEGGVRIVLVYPADRIRAEAAASLLKSLEEPPENTVFMLVADEIDRVLPTIRSRCRLIRAGAPTREQALEWLKSQGVQDAERKLTEAGGMPLAVFDEDARFRLADETRERFLAYLKLGHAAPPAQALSVADKDVTLSAAAIFLSRWGWDLASAKVGCEPQYFPEFAEEIKTIAQAANPTGLYTWINSVRDIRRVSEHPLNAKTMIEALLISYARNI